MKNKSIFSFLKSLSGEEVEFFTAFIAGHGETNDLIAIWESIAESDQYIEKYILAQTGLSRHRKNELFRRLGECAVRALGMVDHEGQMLLDMIAARKMVLRVENDAAKELLLRAYSRAKALERFDIMLELADLASMMTSPIQIGDESKADLLQAKQQIDAFRLKEELLLRIKEPGKTSAERRELLQIVKDSPEFSIRPNNGIKRLQLGYLKLHATWHIFNQEFDAAIEFQTEVLDLLRNHRWLKVDPDFFFAKEARPLAGMLLKVGETDRFDRLIFEVGNLQGTSLRSQMEKMAQLYPFRIVMAIRQGNAEIGRQAVQAALRLLESSSHFPTSTFVTDNLFYASAFLIAVGEYSQARRLLRECKSISVSGEHFRPRIIPMIRVLDVIVAFELNEHDDVVRLVKNFRASKHHGISPCLDNFLVTLQKTSSKPGEFEDIITEGIAILAVSYEDSMLHYFPLLKWMRAKLNDALLINVLRQDFQQRGSESQIAI